MTPVSLLKRVISWTSTVFMLSSYSTGYLRCTASRSKAGGSARRHSLTSPATRASEAPPPGPPLELPPLVDARDWNISAVSFWSLVMSAFWCSPNASGEAVMGRPSMYLQTCHWELSTMLQVIDQVHLGSKSVVKLQYCPDTTAESRASSKKNSGCSQGSRLQAS